MELVPGEDQGQHLNLRTYETLVKPLLSLSMPYGRVISGLLCYGASHLANFFYNFISQGFPSVWGAVSVFLVSIFPDAWVQERAAALRPTGLSPAKVL